MHKNAKSFFRRELLKPRKELRGKNLYSLGWHLGREFDDSDTLGLCDDAKKEITFSKYWFKNPSHNFYREVILHEIAHAMVFILHKDIDFNHGNKWRYLSKKLGCRYGAKLPVKKNIFGKSIIT